ncbi:hypothetical protein [Prescottella equi]|uniref:hypothetical protein n=1 Tax=Rhodococcus hoagii TaxID=43767 RepID=UPI002576E855|nr:hypothetical protein [Prescottella equi]WJJ09869.1 hypothetical protein P9990_14835 [Prescottella equi]
MAPSKPLSVDDVHYFKGQVWPRRKEIIFSKRVALVAILAVATGLSCTHLPVGRVSVSLLSTAGLSFAALSFGACVTGSVLALTIPTPEVRIWATTANGSGRHSHYSDLIFTFTWSGLAQLMVVIASILGFIFGGDNPAAPPNGWVLNSVWVGLAALVFFYALVQLVTAIATISQMGTVLISAWNRQNPSDN